MYRYSLQNVWKNQDQAIKEEIINFWVSEGVIQAPDAQQRVEQVFFVARDLDNKIVGVNTLYKAYNQQLENYFYYYRMFICPKARKYHMTGEMLIKVRDYFESRFVENTNTDVIGLFLEVENQTVKTRLNQAIWSDSQFVYIGKNQRGDHLRVYYFKNALIS